MTSLICHQYLYGGVYDTRGYLGPYCKGILLFGGLYSGSLFIVDLHMKHLVPSEARQPWTRAGAKDVVCLSELTWRFMGSDK